VKDPRTIYVLEAESPVSDPITRFLVAGDLVYAPIRAANRYGYNVKHILRANVWDLRAAVSDPNVFGIVILAHGEDGDLMLQGTVRKDPKDFWSPVVSDNSTEVIRPRDINKETVSRSLCFAVLVVCEGLQKRKEWSDVFNGADIYGYDYKVMAGKTWLDSLPMVVFKKWDIVPKDWPRDLEPRFNRFGE